MGFVSRQLNILKETHFMFKFKDFFKLYGYRIKNLSMLVC